MGRGIAYFSDESKASGNVLEFWCVRSVPLYTRHARASRAFLSIKGFSFGGLFGLSMGGHHPRFKESQNQANCEKPFGEELRHGWNI